MKLSKEKIIQAYKDGKIRDPITMEVFAMTEEIKDRLDEEIPQIKNILKQVKGERGERGEIGPIGPRGEAGKNGINGIDAKPIDTAPIVARATESTLLALKPLIPKITDIEEELPQLGEEIRDGLELLRGEERLDKKAIRGLDDYSEVSRLARIKSTSGGGGGSIARNFYQLFDVPQSYADQANKLVKVNSGETALEFGLRITVADTQPTGPAVGDIWLDSGGLGPV